jgi:molybdopterin-guanine dinucleotide biosynthesis protein A
VLRLAEVCAEVVVVVSPEGPKPDLPSGPLLRLVRDPVEGQGPLAGLAAGLAEVGTELALTVAGDMPELSVAVLVPMVRQARESGAEATVLEQGGTPRPLPAVLRAEPALRAARALLDQGERSIMGLLVTLRMIRLDESTWRALDPEGRTFRDIDLPQDLSG